MATLNITIPDPVVVRLRAALTRPGTLGSNGQMGAPVVPTQADIENLVKEYLRSIIIGYEAGVVADTKRNEITNEGW
jgi:hypothetical protein